LVIFNPSTLDTTVVKRHELWIWRYINPFIIIVVIIIIIIIIIKYWPWGPFNAPVILLAAQI